MSATTSAMPTEPVTLPPVDCAYIEEHDRRLLIVDDEERVRSLFAQCLKERYSCETAANAQEALNWLQGEPFALVITDIQMPGLGGIELLRKINELYRDTAVIVVSGVDRTQRVIDAIRSGAYDYLVKPCDLDVLDLCVDRALERRTLLRNARKYREDLEKRNEELAGQKAELERVQAQLVHSEKMASLGQLAAGVAHELNNPAGFILGNMAALPDYLRRLEKVLSAFETASVSEKDAENIASVKSDVDYDHILSDLESISTDSQEGAERIKGIVQNLRLFSRLDEAELKEVDIHEGIEATIRLLSQYFTGTRITLHRQYENLPRITCYAGQLNQVWMNLLANAAQAIGDAVGEINIKTGQKEECIRVGISDSGCGISEQHLGRIFDPFFTTKPVGEGTGLGLSISHGIVARHGGELTVSSGPEGGTTFQVVLPVNGPITEAQERNINEVQDSDC